MGLNPATHKPLSDTDSLGSPCSKFRFTAPNPQSAQWERSVRQYAHLNPETLDIAAGDLGVENNSSDHFLRAWKSNAGEAFRKGLSFSSSYLQQLRSCGLDVSGFIMQHRNESMRTQRAHQDGNSEKVKVLEQASDMKPLTTYSSSNSAAPFVEHQSPSSALSSADCSTRQQSSESSYVTKRSNMDNAIDAYKGNQVKNNSQEVNAGVASGAEELRACKAAQSETAVKQAEGFNSGESGIVSDQYRPSSDLSWEMQFKRAEGLPVHAGELHELTQMGYPLELPYLKEGTNSAPSMLKEEIAEDKNSKEAILNVCNDLGPVFFMPFLSPEISMDFEEDTHLTNNGSSSKSNILSWQDQFAASEETAQESNNQDNYWSSLMRTIVSTGPVQSSCTNVNVRASMQ